MKRLLVVLASLAVLVAVHSFPVLAEVDGDSSVSVTATSATVTFTSARSSVSISNDEASADELYARVFHCGDTSGAATTSSPIRLEPGENLSLTHAGRGKERGAGYCALSLVCDTGETATARWVAK